MAEISAAGLMTLPISPVRDGPRLSPEGLLQVIVAALMITVVMLV